MQGFDILLDKLYIISEIILPAYPSNGAKTVLLTDHLASTSKTNITTNKSQHTKNLNNN